MLLFAYKYAHADRIYCYNFLEVLLNRHSVNQIIAVRVFNGLQLSSISPPFLPENWH